MKLRFTLGQNRPRTSFAAFGLLFTGLISLPIRAEMVLTAAGSMQGLTLSTFATGFPSFGNVGPLGFAFVSSGVLVSDYPGDVRLFATDTDGQLASSAPIAQYYGPGNAVDIARVGSAIYMTQQSAGTLAQINPSGTFNQFIVSGMPLATGMVADPVTGHLFISAANGIYDVDPLAKTKTVFVSAVADGLTMSADASTIYAEVNGHIIGWNVSTDVQVFDSGFIPGGPDGTAIGAGLFAGQLFVNTNAGQLYEINQSTQVQTLLATGGSRGDFVSVDTTNNTLLLTQTDRILRLNGASFVSSPEPASLALLGCGLAGIALRRRLRRR